MVFLGMAAGIMRAAAAATSLDDLFRRLEDARVMLRIDCSVTPTMAKAPTLATWELDQLRSIEHVVRLGRLRRAEPGRLTLDQGSIALGKDAVVVHCAASGLQNPPLVPVWRPAAITLQPIRAGFPCFGAALVGYLEATRTDDEHKNGLCPPTPYGHTLADWAVMHVRGIRATAAFGSEPDIKAWADGVALNPARIPAGRAGDVDDQLRRLRAEIPRGMARRAEPSEL